jgi:hypothetical protein
MEFCSICQEIKPYRVEEFCITRLYKVCRDCGHIMGLIDIQKLNNLLNELNFYKTKFYDREINNNEKEG